MNIDTSIGNAEDASNYSFSNFYFHPDFLSAKSDSVIKQVFSGEPSVVAKPDDIGNDAPGGQADQKDKT
jgi:hypothetical protein